MDESLGVEYLAAMLKRENHDVRLIVDPELFRDSNISSDFLAGIFSFKKKIVDEAKSYGPDVVCFSVLSDYYSWACDLASEIKRSLDVPIIFGGIHATSVPEIVIKNDFVDFVVAGEGEHALAELIGSLEKGESVRGIKNIWYKSGGKIISNPLRPLVENLDTLPFPDKEIFYGLQPGKRSYTIMTSRGCPFTCTYCNNSILKKLYRGKGKYLRRRSVDNVIEELKMAMEKYGIQEVVFHDEIFTSEPGWLREFSRKYRREINLPFFCWSHPSTLSEETIRLLEYAGCHSMQIGVQTVNKETKQKILNRYESNETLKRVIGLLGKSRIWVTADVMFGLPGQTKEELLDMARFFNENRVEQINIYWLRYFPRTEIVQIAREHGILDDGDVIRLEECRGTYKFTQKGDTYDREMQKLGNLVLITQILPRRVGDFVIRKRMHRFFPPIKLFTTVLVLTVINNAIRKKKKIYMKYTPLQYFRNYLTFMLKRYL